MSDICANCGVAIGNLESAYVWRNNVVCFSCQTKLSDADIGYCSLAVPCINFEKPLGVASIIAGAVAIPLEYVPILCMFSPLIALLGAICGAVAIVVAIMRKRTFGIAMAGVILCGVAFIIQAVVNAEAVGAAAAAIKAINQVIKP